MIELKEETMEAPQLFAPEGALEDTHEAAGTAPSGARPDPEVVVTARRRQFSSSDKRLILEAADRCTEPGDIGALLHKEGIYFSHLATWRQQRAAAERAALAPQKRGRKADPAQAEDRRVVHLTQENDRLRRKLAQAHTIIEVQKNFAPCSGCRRTRCRASTPDASHQPIGPGSRPGAGLLRLEPEP